MEETYWILSYFDNNVCRVLLWKGTGRLLDDLDGSGLLHRVNKTSTP